MYLAISQQQGHQGFFFFNNSGKYLTIILACLLSNVVRKMTAYPCCAGLAHSPFVLTKHIYSGVIDRWLFLLKVKRSNKFCCCSAESKFSAWNLL